MPHQFSTGGKPTLLGISKRGNKGLRELLIQSARADLARPEKAVTVFGNWILSLLSSKPFNVVAIAVTNKLAPIARSVLSTKQINQVRGQSSADLIVEQGLMYWVTNKDSVYISANQLRYRYHYLQY